MKILLATDWFLPSLNGVVISVLNLRRQMEEKGHEVRILTLSQTNRSHREDGVWSVASHSAGRFYPEARVSLRRSDPLIDDLIRWHPDVIHTQCEMSTYRFARRIAKAVGAPMVHTYHTVYEYYVHYLHMGPKLGRSFVSTFSRLALKPMARVIVPTVKTKRLLKEYGVTGPMDIVPTGIDLERFLTPPPEEQLEELRSRYGIMKKERILMTAGRLAKEKNVEEQIEGLYRFCYCEKNNPASGGEKMDTDGTCGGEIVSTSGMRDGEMMASSGMHDSEMMDAGGMHGGGTMTTLMIVGDGPNRSHLERCAEQWQGKTGRSRCRVIFTGEIPQEEMPLYYHLSSCYVSASISETQGLTYIEALASGLPAVCRRDDCLQGVIEEGDNGYLFDDARGFGTALHRLFGDPQSYKAMRERARESAQPYTVQKFGDSVEAVYRAAIETVKGE